MPIYEIAFTAKKYPNLTMLTYAHFPDLATAMRKTIAAHARNYPGGTIKAIRLTTTAPNNIIAYGDDPCPPLPK